MNAYPILSLLLPIVFFISCNNSNHHKEAKKDQKKEITAKTIVVKNEDTNIEYKSYGSGHITLLFVHGWCIDQSYWEHQVQPFSQAYKVVTLNLPGFGNLDTNRTDWSIEQYASDINALIEQLDLQQVILIGHSMGGDIILEAALHNDQVIALVGIDNFKDVKPQFSESEKNEINDFIELLNNQFYEMAPAYAESALFHNSTSNTVKNKVIQSFTSTSPNVATKSLTSLFYYSQKEYTQLSKLKQKLYLINSNATLTDTTELIKTGVNFELTHIDSTGHYPMLEKPDIFNQLLAKTIGKIQSNQ